MRRFVPLVGVVAIATTVAVVRYRQREMASLRTGRGQRNADLARLGVTVGANYASTAARKLFANAERRVELD